MSDRVTEAFEALSTVEPAISWDDVAARTDAGRGVVELADVPDAESPRRWVAVALAAAAIVAVVVVVATRDTDGHVRPNISTSGSTGLAPTNSAPTTLPATRSSRNLAVTAWTGTHYLVWSGEAGYDFPSGRADGWSFDPATALKSDIPTAPIAPRSAAVGVWTGQELIVCCGARVADGPEYRTDTAAAYRPDTGTWRQIADPPAGTGRAYGDAVWTGNEMIAVFGARADQGEAMTIAYDPAQDRWRRLADPPAALDVSPQSAWTGNEMIVWSPEYQHRSALDRGFRYEPATDRWTALPQIPNALAPSLGSMAWTGDEIIVYGQSAEDQTRDTGARLRLGDDAWTALPDPGLPAIDWGEGTPGSQSLVWDGPSHRLVVWPVHGGEYGPTAGPPLLSFDPDDGTWREVASALGYGYQPDLTVGAGAVLVPDRADPVVVRLDE